MQAPAVPFLWGPRAAQRWLEESVADSESETEAQMLEYLRIKTPEEVKRHGVTGERIRGARAGALASHSPSSSSSPVTSKRTSKRTRKRGAAAGKTASAREAQGVEGTGLSAGGAGGYANEIPFWDSQHRKRIKLELARKDISEDLLALADLGRM
ncbi:hypothetical protein FVE85_4828 [Porphyridium purpureum]|uniref:Uncharacterized protein n=1 Tax=Porphyridium purpureum TaxID=35688 RepID=A0A5J4YQ96_PORPP|nr:hypothetical protein FVE85_4828 [Porphyridium purpureum]|eukprot:POR2424..scf236_6